MSTTDDNETTDAPAPTNAPDVVDRDRLQRDRELYGEFRSLKRLSPHNEAMACETLGEVRDAITREQFRTEPRKWIIAKLNDRAAELQEGHE